LTWRNVVGSLIKLFKNFSSVASLHFAAFAFVLLPACVCESLEGNLFAFFEEKSIFRKISKLISVAVKNFCELKVVLPLKATIMMEGES